MKVQIKPGFLFPTQFWTAELNENIARLQSEAYLIKKNDKNGVNKSNSGIQGYQIAKKLNVGVKKTRRASPVKSKRSSPVKISRKKR